jgi:hypothetical protein
VELKTPNTEKEIDREKILKEIERASSKNYVTEWDDGGRIAIQKDKSNIKKGKKSKAGGGQFELSVRKDLEAKGWIVDKWTNNFDLEEGRIIPAKRKYNPFSKVMVIGTGFPDFIAFQLMEGGRYNVIGVEVKMNGTLNRVEKDKCLQYLKNKIFSEIWVASKKKDGRRIRVEYIDVREILDRMR